MIENEKKQNLISKIRKFVRENYYRQNRNYENQIYDQLFNILIDIKHFFLTTTS